MPFNAEEFLTEVRLVGLQEAIVGNRELSHDLHGYKDARESIKKLLSWLTHAYKLPEPFEWYGFTVRGVRWVVFIARGGEAHLPLHGTPPLAEALSVARYNLPKSHKARTRWL